MKKEIHPKYDEIKVSCVCGAEFATKSTKHDEIKVEICSLCHPFYTGKKRMIDSTGRVDKFNKKYGLK